MFVRQEQIYNPKKSKLYFKLLANQAETPSFSGLNHKQMLIQGIVWAHAKITRK